MKITKVVAYGVEIPLVAEKRMISALGRHEVSPFVLVRVETDNGLHGAGEATITPRWSGETVWGTQALVEKLFAPLVVGRDPADIDGLSKVLDRACNHNWFAKSAIEMACWDVIGKDRGVPVYELLGGACRPRKVRCRFSMGAYDVDRARRRAGELIAEGSTRSKSRWGEIRRTTWRGFAPCVRRSVRIDNSPSTRTVVGTRRRRSTASANSTTRI